ncbi:MULTISPECIES: DUF7426 family protein [Rhodococcus]|uniref:DUF7426 family protein n=1 Tax=Rhodococcus TaxID=1827 RepID=UPI001E632438|nr:hypothetical protein [Rhodococcus pyridinivorans]MCD2116802.1 hypothetical protein [Rhodococcus pyridinivorans]MCZ4625990.1 hypothetical protein [Rhodococcus pyridinivorans]MCZ4646945.1 hypothetical protein [Rhodococcus pyridinivorans]MDJ0480297.1 hypothetical protein [Rhodococcus pyridinivorans]MDV7253048.1 hypothetical protein [Rhodococcus pyridinivorans]
MALKDLTETGFDPDLHLPIRGKQYTVPAPDYETAKAMREQTTAEGLPPVEQINQAITALGPAFDEMVADGIPWPMILHAGRTTILHFGFSPDMAEIHWAMAHLGRMVDLEQVSEQLGNLEKARRAARKQQPKE